MTETTAAVSEPTEDHLPPYAKTALYLISDDWCKLGLSLQELSPSDPNLEEVIAFRITALLVPRVVAVMAPLGTYPDLSIASMCRHVLQHKLTEWPVGKNNNINTSNNNTKSKSSSRLNAKVFQELHEFVKRMIKGYKKTVEYHNAQHAFHVVLTASKLVELMIHCNDEFAPETNSHGHLHHNSHNDQHSWSFQSPKSLSQKAGATTLNSHSHKVPPSYGLRNDPLLLFALIFAAVIHDVEHQGIPNRQLAAEKDRLAVLYNDQSIAENWSLYVAFSEFLQDDFRHLRQALFGGFITNTKADNSNSHHSSISNIAKLTDTDEYIRFRKAVVNLVLTTDIASPERTQINKSKWKEAFGDPFETVERKVRAELRRASLTGRELSFRSGTTTSANNRAQRRMTAESMMSELSSPLEGHHVMREEDDVDSLSGTPEGSVHEDDELHPPGTTPDERPAAPARKSSKSNIPVGSGGAGGAPPLHPVPDTTAGGLSSSGGAAGAKDIGLGSTHNKAILERRLSSSSRHTNATTAKYRYRLGILRTVDLSGETLETYSRAGSLSNMSVHMLDALQTTSSTAAEKLKEKEKLTTTTATDGTSASSGPTDSRTWFPVDVEADEPDELKATVVLETLMTAADVAHNMQSWQHLTTWSNRLYMELRKAYSLSRGVDCKPKWFENQIGFLESYMLPLARRLEDTGVFGQDVGALFAMNVVANRDRWLTDGYEEAQKSFSEGVKRFPLKEEN